MLELGDVLKAVLVDSLVVLFVIQPPPDVRPAAGQEEAFNARKGLEEERSEAVRDKVWKKSGIMWMRAV